MSASAAISGTLSLAILVLCPNGVGFTGGGGGAGGDRAPLPAPLTALAVSPDRDEALTGAQDGALQRWDLSGAEPVATAAGQLEGAVMGVAWGPDGLAAAVTDAGHVALLEAGAEAVVIGREPAGCRGVALDPAGEVLATAGADGVIRLWDVAGRERTDALEGHEAAVADLAFAGDDLLVSVGWDRTLRTWRISSRATGRRKARPVEAGTRELTSVAVRPDGELALSGCWDGLVRAWEPGARRPEPRDLPARPHQEWVRQVVFSRDGRRAAAVASAEEAVLVLDPARIEAGPVATLAQPRVSAVAFAPDGEALLVARFDGTLGQVDLPGGAK